jgi:hypothetical protein
VDGFWVTREEVDAFLQTMLETRANLDAWTPRVQSIINRLQRSRQQAWDLARDELFAIRDPAAIPAVESALASAGEDGASMYLEWLSRLDAWEVSVALARQAVHAPSPSVRAQAQQLLQDRRIDDYAPVLLSLLRADPSLRTALYVTPFGGLMYVQQAQVEAQKDVRTVNLAVTYGPEQGVIFPVRGYTVLGSDALITNPRLMQWALSHLQQHYGALMPANDRDVIGRSVVSNDRVLRALSAAVGRDDLQSSHDWWDWWSRYQQVYTEGAKPQLQRDYEETWAVERSRGVHRTEERIIQGQVNMSCFAAGTPVITEYGPKPIEEICLGDRVLAQDVETGEIAFKPVLKATVRPPVDLVKITTEHAELVCTPGHPFWVNGHDWLYARELESGMRFHSVTAGEGVTAVEDAGRKEQAYNLVVADFHTYFAGEPRVLSHDNTPRNPTNALVPGLMPDWSVPAEDDALADN